MGANICDGSESDSVLVQPLTTLSPLSSLSIAMSALEIASETLQNQCLRWPINEASDCIEKNNLDFVFATNPLSNNNDTDSQTLIPQESVESPQLDDVQHHPCEIRLRHIKLQSSSSSSSTDSPSHQSSSSFRWLFAMAFPVLALYQILISCLCALRHLRTPLAAPFHLSRLLAQLIMIKLSPWAQTFALPFSFLCAQVSWLHQDHEDHRSSSSSKKSILVLDLDETLVHTSQIPGGFPIPLGVRSFYVQKRPHVDRFLEELSKHFELVVFTASRKEYANQVVDYIDSKRVVSRRIFREGCEMMNGELVKDLSTVCPSLERVFLLDNSPSAYAKNQSNAVPILPWFDKLDDSELLDLIPFLESLRVLDDVRSLLELRCAKLRMQDLPLSQ